MAKLLINGIVTNVDEVGETTYAGGRILPAHKIVTIEETQTTQKGQVLTYQFEVKYFGNAMGELNIGNGTSLVGCNITTICKCVGRRNDKGYLNYQLSGESIVINSFSRLETPTQEQKEQEIPQQTAPSIDDISDSDLPF